MNCSAEENDFGPVIASSCRVDSFDFTLFFEETILTILPLGVLLSILVPLLLHWTISRRRPAVMHFHKTAIGSKGVLFAALIGLESAQLLLWFTLPSLQKVQTKASIPAVVMRFSSAVALAQWSYVQHIYSQRPSTIIVLSVLVWTIFDVVKLRTLWLLDADKSFTVLISVAVGIKVLLVICEEARKGTALSTTSPESHTGILGRVLLTWLNPLMYRGIRGAALSTEDLYSVDEHVQSRLLEQLAFQAIQNRRNTGNYNLFLLLLRVHAGSFLAATPARLALVGLTASQPYLIQATLNWLSEPRSSHSDSTGYALLGAYALVYIGIAITTAFNQSKIARFITVIRGSLVSLIYRKTLEMQIMDVDGSAPITLMSTDVEQITKGLQYVHEAYAAIITVGIAFWLLERQLGLGAVAPIAVAIVTPLLVVSLGAQIGSAQKRWVESVERRVDFTTKLLSAIKSIKLSGLMGISADRAQQLRRDELTISLAFRRFLTIGVTLSYLNPTLSPVLGFTIYVIRHKASGHILDASQAFTVLSIFTLLCTPLDNLIQTLPFLIGTLSCFKRIQDFLVSDSRVDYGRSSYLMHNNDKGSEKYSAIATGCDCLPSGGGTHVEDEQSNALSEENPIFIYTPLTLLPQTDFAQSLMTLDFLNSSDLPIRATNVDPIDTESISSIASDDENDHTGDDIIRITHGTFAWKKDSEPVLRDINIGIKQSSLMVILGPSGCGKSTLLLALLREPTLLHGYVNLDTSFTYWRDVAYCPQNPWLRNEDVRRIIIGNSAFDPDWYDRTLHACALDKDFESLSRGSLGSGGLSLSGGQKVRIALARAVYSRKRILVLDDVMSGLDSQTEAAITQRLLGSQGLLRGSKTTVVLASQNVRHFAIADYVVLLGADGRVEQQGRPSDMELAGILRNAKPIHKTKKTKKSSDNELHNPLAFAMATKNETTATDPRNRRKGELAAYKYYINSLGGLKILVSIGLVILFVFFSLFPQIWVSWWTSYNVQHPNGRLGYWLGIYAAFGAIALVSLFTATWLLVVRMVRGSAESLHAKLVDTIRGAPMSLFVETDSGTTVNRFSQDMSLIDMELPMAFASTIIRKLTILWGTENSLSQAVMISTIAQLVFLAITTRYLAAVFPAIIAIFCIVQRLYIRTSRQLRFLDLEAKAPLYTQFIESMKGLASIRAYGWESVLKEQMYELIDRSQRPFYLLLLIQRWLGLVLNLINAALAVLIIGLAIILRSKLNTGFLGVALVNLMSLGGQLSFLLETWTTLETSLAAVERVKHFTEETPRESNDCTNGVAIDTMTTRNWPRDGRIEIANISASYGNQPGPALRNVSLSIRAGEKIAICGHSGSGKSSFILALFRMLTPTSGTIRIADHDISYISHEEVRAKIGIVPQDPYIMDGSLRYNVDPENKHSDDQVIQVLQRTGLWDLVKDKEGLSTTISGDGALSQSRQQMVCLARALIKESKILVLDEATSSVDDNTDAAVHNIIRHQLPNTTVISVMHKLEHVHEYDRVGVMQSGELVELGTPQELLVRDGSRFAAMWRSYEDGGM